MEPAWHSHECESYTARTCEGRKPTSGSVSPGATLAHRLTLDVRTNAIVPSPIPLLFFSLLFSRWESTHFHWGPRFLLKKEIQRAVAKRAGERSGRERVCRVEKGSAPLQRSEEPPVQRLRTRAKVRPSAPDHAPVALTCARWFHWLARAARHARDRPTTSERRVGRHVCVAPPEHDRRQPG